MHNNGRKTLSDKRTSRLLPEHATILAKFRLPIPILISSLALQQPQHYQPPQQDHANKLFFAVSNSRQHQDVQLSGTHRVGSGTSVEITIKGSKEYLTEFRLKLGHCLSAIVNTDYGKLLKNGQLALSFVSDLQHRHRLTLEGTMGIQKDKHILSTVLTSDFASRFAWGFATSHRFGKLSTLFSRYSRDESSGQRFLFQTVHELNANNTISTICAATVGRHPEAGVSWCHHFCLKEGSKESVQLKTLCNGDGTYSVSINAQVGVLDC